MALTLLGLRGPPTLCLTPVATETHNRPLARRFEEREVLRALTCQGGEKVESRASYPSEDPREIVEYNAMKAVDRLGLDSEKRTLLNMPYREIRLEVPVRIDNGSLRVFVGYRVQHAGVRVARAERLRGTQRRTAASQWPSERWLFGPGRGLAA